MKCFARWEIDNQSGYNFRDQTLLQFGDSWNLLANFVLLNPGSALPLNEIDRSEFLRSKSLPFYVEPSGKEVYLEFSLDRLMQDIFKLFSANYSGGTIRIYNLFNLQNQNSKLAISQIVENQLHPKMFSKSQEIKFCSSPVIIASGANASQYPLKKELIKFITYAEPSLLYSISQINNKQFSILKSKPDTNGFIISYHPSYTCKYGNVTSIGDLLSH